jgi:8-oxo-dGTP pyrophosphatase MutT (NUDIX family)
VSKPPKSQIRLICAAGGLLWRDSGHGRELLLVHRKRYDDWSLPKGKLEEGEGWEAAAVREVVEETGYKVSLDDFAGIVSYVIGGSPKVVLFWNMQLDEQSEQHKLDSDGEVDRCDWLTVNDALKRLSYGGERGLLARVTR